MFPRALPVPELGADATVEALVFLVDKSKTNTNGRLDKHGALRHRDVLLCCLGSLAQHFWVQFHVLHKLHPDFAPDHSDLEYGEFGYCSWYMNYLFPGSEGDDVQMSYKNHHAQVTKMHKDKDISISKATHGGRSYAAYTSRQHGASKESVKAIGWSAGDSFSACYDQALPLDALMGAAMFNTRNFASYFIA
ncbi:hypothetical protein BDP27DRAFT_1430087 [Rhodocollybia butyracea]|uniref:Ndc10 domain-containing protein n=1 Tax=Rhodocollybia butyracea TaxID=206335 RepID=A0A9P5U0F3_9AGAR|nr:hypothetical protein BDP27DRAFT_1430087 [Rhodocollybia butyracea]